MKLTKVTILVIFIFAFGVVVSGCVKKPQSAANVSQNTNQNSNVNRVNTSAEQSNRNVKYGLELIDNKIIIKKNNQGLKEEVVKSKDGYSIKDFIVSHDGKKVAFIEVLSKIFPLVEELYNLGSASDEVTSFSKTHDLELSDFSTNFVVYDIENKKKQEISNQDYNLVKHGYWYFDPFEWSKNDRKLIVILKNFYRIGMGGCPLTNYIVIDIETNSFDGLRYECIEPPVLLDNYSVVVYIGNSYDKPMDTGCMGECPNYGKIIIRDIETGEEYQLNEENLAYKINNDQDGGLVLKYTTTNIQDPKEINTKEINVRSLLSKD